MTSCSCHRSTNTEDTQPTVLFHTPRQAGTEQAACDLKTLGCKRTSSGYLRDCTEIFSAAKRLNFWAVHWRLYLVKFKATTWQFCSFQIIAAALQLVAA
ncbi:NADPH-dependent 7-cyano-7-deazaguanine reductase [Trichinella pseudospiralis]